MAEHALSELTSDVEAAREIAVAALRQYPGRFFAPELVKHRENSIFSVRRSSGERLALRVHRAGYHSDAALQSELQWMEALADAGLPVPNVIRSLDSRTVVHVAPAGSPAPRQVDLLTWLDGQSLGELETQGQLTRDARRRLYFGLGELAARLHSHAGDWARPQGFVRHDWFADALVGETPLWGAFWTLQGLGPGQVSLLLRARDRAAAALAAHDIHDRNTGLVHADLIADNVIVEGACVKPIDFDDAGFGWHMFEIATILHFVTDDPDYPALRDAVFAGYRSARPLPAAEEAALPLFLTVRSMTYLGWVQSRSETSTAIEQAPSLIERCCRLCTDFLG